MKINVSKPVIYLFFISIICCAILFLVKFLLKWYNMRKQNYGQKSYMNPKSDFTNTNATNNAYNNFSFETTSDRSQKKKNVSFFYFFGLKKVLRI